MRKSILLLLISMMVACGGGENPQNGNEAPVFENTTVNVLSVGLTGCKVGWNPAKDDKGVVEYTVFVDGVSVLNLNGEQNVANIDSLEMEKNYLIEIQAVDQEGLKSDKISTSITTNRFPENITEVAPQFDGKTIPSFSDRVDFIYKGENAIQFDVQDGAIDSNKVSILRGKIESDSGEAIEGAKISILNSDFYGWTISRKDGWFDIAVNGGSQFVIKYEKTGYIPVQRKVDTTANDFFFAKNVVMIPYDQISTAIDLNSDSHQIAQGSLQSDKDGDRKGVLIFPPKSKASVKMRDGKRAEPSDLNIRITEYTVGERGEDRMPGELPSTSGYTYAVEISADGFEDAITVEFDKTLYYYVENFLNFPVGGVVPSGYYDREKGHWVSSKNGKVIKVVDIREGAAFIDSDGDGVEDEFSKLEEIGFTEAELKQLATQYEIGASLWRVPITHFTPWDYNWPYGCRECESPRNDPPGDDDDCNTCETSGSIIGVQHQSLGEVLPIAGTLFTLHYQSKRNPKSNRSITITASGESIPSNVKRVKVSLKVAGKIYEKEFEPEANIKQFFEWDGKDIYGRDINGSIAYRSDVTYYYDAVYMEPNEYENSFAQYTNDNLTLDKTRNEISFTETHKAVFDTFLDSKNLKNGGWTVSAQHIFDGEGNIYKGNGKKANNSRAMWILSSVKDYYDDSNYNYLYLKAGKDNQTYYKGSHKIYQKDENDEYIVVFNAMRNDIGDFVVSPSGIIYVVYNNYDTGSDEDSFIIEFNPKTGEEKTILHKVQHFINSIDIDSNGLVHYVHDNQIYTLYNDGFEIIIAGKEDGLLNQYGIVAKDAKFEDLKKIAIDKKDNIYISDSNGLKKISTDGVLTLIYESGYIEDFVLGVGNDESVYINGTIQVKGLSIKEIIGGCFGDYYDGSTYCLFGKCDFDGSDAFIDSEGNYLELWECQEVKVGEDARNFWWPSPQFHGMNAEGNLFIDDGYVLYEFTNTIKDKEIKYQNGSYRAISSEDGTILYLTDQKGNHKKTVDALTGQTLYDFTYNDDGFLTKITDLNGLETKIIRDSDGNATKIISPYGEETVLEVDDAGDLTKLTIPGGLNWRMEYNEDGLLTKFTNPRGKSSTFTYNDEGKLERDTNAANGYKELAKVGNKNNYTVSLKTAMGRVSKYAVKYENSERIWEVTSASGFTTKSVEKDDETVIEKPNGMKAVIKKGTDPRFGASA
ncbi:hypothetical protein JXR93_08015, partial [bacterium]|nr:hypothetical protein [bacterium]